MAVTLFSLPSLLQEVAEALVWMEAYPAALALAAQAEALRAEPALLTRVMPAVALPETLILAAAAVPVR